MNPFPSSHRSRITLLAAALAMTLGACGGGDKETEAKPDGETARNAEEAKPDAAPAADKPEVALSFVAPKLADGTDACFRLIGEQLGQDVKLSEVTSFFSSGADITNGSDKPVGDLVSCSVEYQNPDDPRKLLSRRLDLDTGLFSEPQPMEITVMGNAADFKLDDYVVPLSQINAAALSAVMASQDPALAKAFGKYAWNGVRLEGPSAFNSKHTLRIDVTGRLAANDIKENGYASVSLDGKTITKNHLLP